MRKLGGAGAPPPQTNVGARGQARGSGCHGSLVAEPGELEMPVTDGPFFLFVPLSPSFSLSVRGEGAGRK